jgi:ribosomal protein L37AE/L43A
LGLVFLSTLVVAASFALIYKVNATILPLALTVTSAAGLGLASGFAARWILRSHTGLLRGLVALTALIFGLSLLGLITLGVTGISLLDRTRIDPDWDGLGQLALGAVAAWLALRSWRTTTPAQSLSREPEPLSQRPVQQAPATRVRRRREQAPVAPRRRLHLPALLQLHRPAFPRLHLPTMPRPGFRLTLSLGRRQSQVRLERDEEHRCPYCLEPVSRSDPRGFVVCKICHTYHHADCWAVTGMCQVPHHHE